MLTFHDRNILLMTIDHAVSIQSRFDTAGVKSVARFGISVADYIYIHIYSIPVL